MQKTGTVGDEQLIKATSLICHIMNVVSLFSVDYTPKSLFSERGFCTLLLVFLHTSAPALYRKCSQSLSNLKLATAFPFVFNYGLWYDFHLSSCP
jgi:hypothetical protein